MKKLAYLLFYLTISLLFLTTISSSGQSTVITPSNALSENYSGDNIVVSSNSNLIGVQGLRFNGTVTSKSPVMSGNPLLTIGAGGYYNSSLSAYDRAAINFVATQNWSEESRGTRIQFSTTTNNTPSAVNRMVIDQTGNVGIGIQEPLALLHLRHVDPVIHLQSNGGIGFGAIIKASSTESGVWENVFAMGSTPTSNLIYWNNPTFGTTPLAITGEGDAFVERNTSVGGYTNLGTDAPKIKMKKLTLTTSGASGGEVGVAHGLTQTKILSVSVLVNGAAGNDIAPNTTIYSGYEYTFYVSASSIFIQNSTGNHSSIAGKPARILITYEE